jgi:hypothetical protein
VDRSGPETRYVLTVGDEASALAERDDVAVVRRLADVVLVCVDARTALAIARADPLAHVYESREDAMRAFFLFVSDES